MNIEEKPGHFLWTMSIIMQNLSGFKVSNYKQSFSIKLETLEADVFKQLRNKAAASYIQENCNWTFDTKTKRNFCKNLNSARF